MSFILEMNPQAFLSFVLLCIFGLTCITVWGACIYKYLSK